MAEANVNEHVGTVKIDVGRDAANVSANRTLASRHSTVTLLAKFLGLSTSVPRAVAV
jgi:hypothetical protein